MEDVTAEQCKAVVVETGMKALGHHRCMGCGSMVGHRFLRSDEAFIDSAAMTDEIVVAFDSNCDCVTYKVPPKIKSWEEFAGEFNRQTPKVRERMWERFKAGKATHEID